MELDLSAIRKEYVRTGLHERDADPDAVVQLERWVNNAVAAGHPEPTAMTLATVSAAGDPSARVVLLKQVDPRGLVFFTNYESAKARELGENPRASVCIFWVLLERQVRVLGTVSKVSDEESDEYFASRPRGSQLGAWASTQSAVVESREKLELQFADVMDRFGEGKISRPPNWGGFRIVPSTIEFWQGRANRLHDRLRYTRIDSTDPASWRIERLSP